MEARGRKKEQRINEQCGRKKMGDEKGCGGDEQRIVRTDEW